MLTLLSSLTQTWQGVVVIVGFVAGVCFLASLFVGLLWSAVGAWNARQYRREQLAHGRKALLSLDDWKKAKDVEDSVLYRDFKSEQELACERIAVPGEVI